MQLTTTCTICKQKKYFTGNLIPIPIALASLHTPIKNVMCLPCYYLLHPLDPRSGATIQQSNNFREKHDLPLLPE